MRQPPEPSAGSGSPPAGPLSISDIRAMLSAFRGRRRRVLLKGFAGWMAAQGGPEQVIIMRAARARGAWWPWRVWWGALWRTVLWTLGAGAMLAFVGAVLDAATGGSFGAGSVAGCGCCALPVMVIFAFAGTATGLRDLFCARSLCEPNCTRCGYDLSGLSGDGGADAVTGVRCPECGVRDTRTTLAPTVLAAMRTAYQPDLSMRWWRAAPAEDRAIVLREWRKRHRLSGPDNRTFLAALGAVVTGIACVMLSMTVSRSGGAWSASAIAMSALALAVGCVAGAYFTTWFLARVEVRDFLGRSGCPGCDLGRESDQGGFGGGACPGCGAPELRRGITMEDLLAEVYGGGPTRYAPVPLQPPAATDEQP